MRYKQEEAIIASRIENYLLSKKFKTAMSKVGSDSIPFNNSTPTKDVLIKIEEANRRKANGK